MAMPPPPAGAPAPDPAPAPRDPQEPALPASERASNDAAVAGALHGNLGWNAYVRNEVHQASQGLQSAQASAERARAAFAQVPQQRNAAVNQLHARSDAAVNAMYEGDRTMRADMSRQFRNLINNPKPSAVGNRNNVLGGEVFESHHKQTLKANELYAGKEPSTLLENTRAKGSSDLTVKMADGSTKEHCMKACGDAKKTAGAIGKAEYKGQRKVVPAEQVRDIPRKDVRATAKGQHGIKSDPMTTQQKNAKVDALVENKPFSQEKVEKMYQETESRVAECESKFEEKARKCETEVQAAEEQLEVAEDKKANALKKQGTPGGRVGKAVLIATATALVVAFVTSLWTSIDQYSKGLITKAQAFCLVLDTCFKATASGAGMGLVIALIDELAHGTRFAPFVGPAVAGCLALYQCVDPIRKWWRSELAGLACCKEVCSALTSAGASYFGAIAGAAMLTAGGPVGMIIGGMIGGWFGNKCVSWALDVWHWAAGTRRTDALLKIVVRIPNRALNDEIIEALEGWGPWGWWKRVLTALDYQRLEQLLRRQRRSAALSLHPDRAHLRGDNEAQRVRNAELWLEYEDAYEQLLNDLRGVAGVPVAQGPAALDDFLGN